MKKFLSFGLALVLVFVFMLAFSMTAFAVDDEVQWNYTIANGEATITGYYNFNGEELVIPDTLGDVPVTAIGDNAFKSKITLQKITIPGSIKDIGVSAFSGCSALQTVVLSNGLTTIGREAFFGCRNLEIIQFPDSLTNIGSYAFNGCNNLRSVDIPANVQTIGGDAFLSCLSLETINVDENNTDYSSQNGILYNKDKTELLRYPQSKPEKSFSIPDLVTAIHREAFSGCRYLESVTVPGSVEDMEMGFLNFHKLKEVVIREGVTKISDSAFQQCWDLQKVTLPQSLIEIDDAAFFGCKSLQEIQLPENLQTIGYRSFAGCSALTKVFIPETVTNIGSTLVPMSKDVFAECDLDNLYLYVRQNSKAHEYAEMHGFNYKITCLINVTAESNGTASGGGITGNGEEVNLQAEANDGYKFIGWYNGTTKLSEANPYTFTAEKDLNIIAKFARHNQGGGGGGSSSSKDNTTTVTPDPVIDSDEFFVDVADSDWYYTAVKDVYTAGLMNGVDATHFEPNTDITRGMFVTILHRLAGKPQPTEGRTNPFADVAISAYYTDAVIWANANGIIKGISETAYAPDQVITREQMAAIIYRYVSQVKPDETQVNANAAQYTDNDQISTYAKDAVNWCSSKGIIKGNPNNQFEPLANATRAEAATVLLRVQEYIK